MKKYHYITSLLLAGSSLLMTGCQDDFAELKQPRPLDGDERRYQLLVRPRCFGL